MNRAATIYVGSDGEATKAFYAELQACGVIGEIAVNLFRAQKCSSRAKVYRGGGFRSDAYVRKDWSIRNLTQILTTAAVEIPVVWGWKRDANTPGYEWVLYVDLPNGQVSFHCGTRHAGPDYVGEWCGEHLSGDRIIAFCDGLLRKEEVMGQHYTRNTVSTEAWCAKCDKRTQHHVNDRRLGPCIPCCERLEAESKARKEEPPPAEQKGLFA